MKTFYDFLPAGLQNLILTGISLKLSQERYGGQFDQFKRLLHEMESASSHDISAFQNENLAKLVDHAYRTVPYYKHVFDQHGLKPKDVQTSTDLHKVPLLTKEQIKTNFKALQSTEYPRKWLKDGHTSGTTGTPLEVLYCPRSIAMGYAALDRHYRWTGARLSAFGDRIAVFRGNVIVPLYQNRPPFWRYNWYHRQLLFSNFHLKMENMSAYFEALRSFKPKVLDGYPSSLFILAKVLLSRNNRLPLQAVITSSETLYEHQREAIEEALECHVFDYYAAAERVVFASECEYHSGHHLYPEYGIVEFIGDDNLPISDGSEGTMVGTTLHNYGMPLIRYVTSDRTRLKNLSCKCGRPFPLIDEVTTKAEDMLRLPDGRLLSPSVLTHPFKPLNSINGSQLIQTDIHRLVVRLIPKDDYNSLHEQQLIRDLKARLGTEMEVEIEYVNNLPLTSAGKFKWVVSHVDLGI